jgi:muramoyltetrapeptide carboxypeptidase
MASKKIIIPPYLQKGDTVGIVCPAGYMALDKAQKCIDVLQQWGYKVKLGKTIGAAQENYFSGTDAERLTDLQLMMDDKEVCAILCGRGGYGVGRIIDDIKFTKFLKNPKWIIGFSDITVLHGQLFNLGIASLHAPMAAAFNDGEDKNDYIQSLRKALSGKPASYSVLPNPNSHLGEATGQLVGGNLSLLVNIIGTASDIDTNGKILFIEDIGEYIYSIDRMLHQLKRAGKLKKIKGLIFGGFTDMKDTTSPFGRTMDEVLADLVREFEIPICFGFPVSHGKENYALKIGVQYQMKVNKTKVLLKEIV